MRRREFITFLGSAAATWPFAVRAQQGERVRRIGVLMNIAEDDPQSKVGVSAFERGLGERGWTLGSNMQIEYRWGAGDASRYRKYAPELVALSPDVIMAVGGTAVGALQQASRTVPIVFVAVTDPVSRGLVASLARPSGNTTGFIEFEYNMCAKWPELLKQIAPGVTRAAVIRDPIEFSGIGQLAAIQSVAPSFGIEISAVDARDAKEIERTVTEFARRSKWRPDRDVEWVVDWPSQIDHHARSPAQAARGVRRPILRHRRRLNLIWGSSDRPIPPRR